MKPTTLLTISSAVLLSVLLCRPQESWASTMPTSQNSRGGTSINGNGLRTHEDAEDVQRLKAQMSKLCDSLRTALAENQLTRTSPGLGSARSPLLSQRENPTMVNALLRRYIELLKSPPGLSAKRLRSQSDSAQVRIGGAPSSAAPNATFVVNRTSDEEDADINDGKCDINLATLESECTLRAAIEQANANPGKDVINFSIGSGGAQTIKVGTHRLGIDLPQIGDPVDIDGTTQPGYAGTPLIELDGTIAFSGAGTGLSIAAGNTTVKGLVINRFLWGIYIWTNGSNLIQGNYIGTDISGAAALGNTYGGIFVETSQNTISANVLSGHNLPWGAISIASQATNNLVTGNFIGTDFTGTVPLGNFQGVGIGGSSLNSVTGNVISASSIGVFIGDTSAVDNVVQGNAIGVSSAGNTPLGNLTGIWLAAPNNIIGGTLPKGNTISGNGAGGILIMGNGIATGNQIQGNFIGTDATGAFALPNGTGITIWEAKNTIGGDAAGAGNVVSGNTYGITLIDSNATENNVQGNFIGTDSSGTHDVGNTSDGILIFDAPRNQIGGITELEGNVIAANDSAGVHIMGRKSVANWIGGNLIGLGADGRTAYLGNWTEGILIHEGASNTTIGVNAGNVISVNGQTGITIEGIESSGNVVQGNFIGTDKAGEITNPNGVLGDGDELGNWLAGIRISDSPGNLIGGTTSGARNIISGNREGGVYIFGENATDNKVQGNYIGTNVTGTRGLGNIDFGIAISGAPNNQVGGNVPGAGNVISDNTEWGVAVDSTAGSLIQGNFIGTDADGISPLGNTGGVLLSETSGNTIKDNVVSANRMTGVAIHAGASNKVQGNRIGTDATGSAPLGNRQGGIDIVGSHHNLIGGTLPGQGNVISGNDSSGVEISGSNSYNNELQGNFIGADITGKVLLGNARDGVLIYSEATNNTIGGAADGADNVIAGNGRNGILMTDLSGTGNAVLCNSIFANALLGIDLHSDGVTPNDQGDSDSGANNLQNYPVLTGFSASTTGTTITGTLNSTPNSSFRLEFFSNSEPDGSSYGEGEQCLGAHSVTTNSSGDVDFVARFPGVFPKGSFATATATDANNNTSEFSRCFAGTNPIITKVIPPAARRGLTNVALKIAGANFVPATVVSVQPSAGVDIVPPAPPDYGYIGPTELKRTINIASDAVAGERNVFVTNPNGESGGIPPYNRFTVTDGVAADLSVSLRDDPDPVAFGRIVTYTVKISNNGPEPATGATLTDDLRDVGAFVSATVSQGSWSESGGVVTCALGTLASSDTATVTIMVTAPSFPSRVGNTVSVANNEIDADTTNNTARVVTEVQASTAVGERPKEVPSFFSLAQNYPNPFNPSTTIRFALPKRSTVTLKLFDMLGRELATLVDEELPPGDYEVVFDARGLSTGVYFYRLQAERFHQTKKLMLLK